MSYVSDIKSQLLQTPTTRDCCAWAELAAMLLLSGSISLKGLGRYSLTFASENAAVVRYCFTQIKRLFQLSPEIRAVKSNQRGEHTSYQLEIEGADAVKMLETLDLMDKKSFFGIRKTPSAHMLRKDCCRRSFLRGAFLACGWINQPEKAYHLEFAAPDEQQAEKLQSLMSQWSLEARVSPRKNQFIVYLKNFESVETLLRLMGLTRAALEYENVRVMKSLNNALNRQMICDDFNTDKTVRAAATQMEDIAVIEKYLGFANLPEPLRNLAEARLNNPDATLTQLGELVNPPVGKSTVNNRMRRLSAMAEKLRDEHAL